MKIEWNGEGVTESLRKVLENSLLECGLDLQQESVDEAPVDTGDLRGNCTAVLFNSGKPEVHVGYNLPYAIVQHERLDFNHPMGGKAKYLEDPYNRNKEKYVRHIANRIKGGTK